MILDLKYMKIDGKEILFKFAPKLDNDNGLTIDQDGFLQFDISRFSWQPVLKEEEKKSLNIIFKQLEKEILCIT